MAVYSERQRAAAPSPAPTEYGRERTQLPGGRAFTAVLGWPKPSVAASSWSPKVSRTYVAVVSAVICVRPWILNS